MCKICLKCKETKLFEDFGKDRTRCDGLYPYCKQCSRSYRKNRYNSNKESYMIRGRKYVEQNSVKVAERKKSWYLLNKERLSKVAQQLYIDNKDDRLQSRKKYRELNPQKINAINAKRRALKLKATPHWLSLDDLTSIEELYTIALAFRLYTGQDYHVDHIVPLQGKNVCGLHVPWNLQVISAKDNIKKSNKF